MTQPDKLIEVCPRCKSADYTRPKMLLVNRGDPDCANEEWRSWSSEHSMRVTDLNAETLKQGVIGQFVQGLYCEQCGLAYVPEGMLKPALPRYESVVGGFCRLNPDGTRGPLLERISDDPSLQNRPAEHTVDPVAAVIRIDELEASRIGSELLERHGSSGYIIARAFSTEARASGQLGAAEFWLRVSGSIRPR